MTGGSNSEGVAIVGIAMSVSGRSRSSRLLAQLA